MDGRWTIPCFRGVNRVAGPSNVPARSLGITFRAESTNRLGDKLGASWPGFPFWNQDAKDYTPYRPRSFHFFRFAPERRSTIVITSARGLGARNLLFGGIEKKQIPRSARDDNP